MNRVLSLGLVLALAGIAGIGPAGPAAAVSCYKHNMMTYTTNTNGNLQHYGVKAQTGIWVPDGSQQDPVCGRASSIMLNPNGSDGAEEVEIGWYEDPLGSAQPVCRYPVGGTLPRQLMTYTHNGYFSCVFQNQPPLVPSGFEPFNVHEDDPSTCTPSHNTWDYVENGVTQAFLVNVVDMCTGVVTTNGDRHSSSDSAKSEFEGLQIYGASGNFVFWNNNKKCWDNDGEWDPVIDSATHSEVKLGSDPNVPICY